MAKGLASLKAKKPKSCRRLAGVRLVHPAIPAAAFAVAGLPEPPAGEDEASGEDAGSDVAEGAGAGDEDSI
jgi:hypothetical protein